MPTAGLNPHKGIGPWTKARYLNSTGSVFLANGWRAANVLSIRLHRSRLKLTVDYPTALNPTEVTLNLWRETPTGYLR